MCSADIFANFASKVAISKMLISKVSTYRKQVHEETNANPTHSFIGRCQAGYNNVYFQFQNTTSSSTLSWDPPHPRTTLRQQYHISSFSSQA